MFSVSWIISERTTAPCQYALTADGFLFGSPRKHTATGVVAADRQVAEHEQTVGVRRQGQQWHYKS
jgi:hypothetical protein